MLSERRCAFQFPLFPTFRLSVPPFCGDFVVSRTRLQLGNQAFCVAGPVAWNSLQLDIRSAPSLHYKLSKTCSRHIFSHVPTSLTNCFAEHKQRTLYGALVMTLAMLLRFVNCRFIIIIIINWRKLLENRKFHFCYYRRL